MACRSTGRPLEFTFTPKHGSWLNLIEGFFSKFARSVLRQQASSRCSTCRRSSEDARRCSSLIPRVRSAGRLDQQDVYFPTGHRPVLDASGHNKDLAGVEADGAVLQFDVERTLEHKEKIVRVLVLMPVEWPLELSHQYVVVVIKKNQDLEAAGRDINDCLVVLRAAAGRLAPGRGWSPKYIGSKS